MEQYEVFDGCYGTVIGTNRYGAYLELPNGSRAFAYKFASLKYGSRVLCTVLKKAKEEKDILVSIDSVLEYAA
ncbi:MAG: hypothetical protein Q4D21_03135 [Phascolarctobacterium sp.]|nr:hypothetical protein [Phascolarctobacterium sp.]